MRRLQGRDDARQPGELECRLQRLLIRCAEEGGSLAIKKMRMQGTDARIIETGRNAVRFHDLAILRLHNEALAAVQHAWLTQLRSGCAHSAVDAMSRGLYRYQLYTEVVQEVIECPRRIAAATHAGDDMRRQFAARLFFQLYPDLLADDALKPGHHIGVRMGSYYAADDVMCVHRVVDPIPYGLVGSIFQGLAAADGRHYFGAQHLHPRYIGRLPLDILLS